LLGLVFSLAVAVGPALAADTTSGDGGVPLVAMAILVLVTLAGIVALGCVLSPLIRGPRERRVAIPPATGCEGDAIEAELQWILRQAHAQPSRPHMSRSLD